MSQTCLRAIDPGPRIPTARTCRNLACGTALLAVVVGMPRASSGQDKKDRLPEPEQITLKTAGGLTLAATYYPSKLDGEARKDAVPLILVHAYQGNRGDLAGLGRRLQAAGHAAIAPDLRGHGESSAADTPVRSADLAAMVRFDLEASKRFLVDKNNQGALNIERLGVIGVEMGSTLALNWAALDWSWPVLATGKQGQDVKALVLVSPEWSFKGMRINDALAHPNVRRDLSVLILAGRRNSKLLRSAERLHGALDRFHVSPRDGEEADKQTLWLKTPSTSLQSTQLLNEEEFQVHQMILDFVELRLVKQAFPWRMRKSPLQ